MQGPANTQSRGQATQQTHSPGLAGSLKGPSQWVRGSLGGQVQGTATHVRTHPPPPIVGGTETTTGMVPPAQALADVPPPTQPTLTPNPQCLPAVQGAAMLQPMPAVPGVAMPLQLQPIQQAAVPFGPFLGEVLCPLPDNIRQKYCGWTS